MEQSTSRKQRAAKRNRNTIVENAIEEYDLRNSLQADATLVQISDPNRSSVETQTEIDFGCVQEIKIRQMEKEMAALRKDNARMKHEMKSLRHLEKSVKAIFTSGQIKKLKTPRARVNWSLDDISSSICLHSAGPRAYRYLYKKSYPLPGSSTLRKWAAKMDVRPGILEHVLIYMKHYELTERGKICVISFDEMKIRSEYEYDKTHDTMLKPANYVQVVMVRGLVGKWKQPIFYNYDCRMTAEILFEIITKLHAIQYVVVAIVSDMGSTNQGLWRELGISVEQTWFENPADQSMKVFVFADVPHLIKLLRNHFLDTGFIYKNKIINSAPIKEVMQITSSSDVNTLYKITDVHINKQFSYFCKNLCQISGDLCI